MASTSPQRPNTAVYRHVAPDATEDEDAAAPSTITIDQAIERVGTGRFQTRVLMAAGLCFAADAMQLVLLSFLTLVLQDLWNLSSSATASITATIFAGAMVGTLVLGPLADTHGRRPIFLLAAGIITSFGFFMALAPNYWILVACIFVIGFGVGGLTVPFDVLAECLPAQGRGTNLLMIEYFWTSGCLYVVAVAYLTLGAGYWRAFVAACAIPCGVSLVMGYLCVPESPRWLVAQGRRDEAMGIMRHIASTNGHDPDWVFPSTMQLAEEHEEKQATVADLFTPKWRETTLRLWGAWCAFAFGYYGTIMATTRVFAGRQAAGHHSAFDYSAIFISSSAEIIGTTLVIYAVDRVGRIPSQVVSYAVGGIAVCLLCVLAQLGSDRNLLVAIGFVARVAEMSATCVTWVSTAEILTTEVRSTGHATSNAWARIGAFFCPYLVQGSTPFAQIGIVMLVVHFFTLVCVYKLPETKGRSMGAELNDDPNDEDNLLVDDVEEEAVVDVLASHSENGGVLA